MQLNRILETITNIIKNSVQNHNQETNSEDSISDLENKISYHFNDKKIILQALKHRSFLSISGEQRLYSNERLELLGDSVIGLIVTEYLYKHFPEKEEGDLTSMKSLIVSRKVLAEIANDLNLGKYIFINEAEEKAGGRNRPSIVADALEALTGAVYIDGGLEQAVGFVKKFVLAHLNSILNEEQNQNFKSILLEYSQSKCYGLPCYFVKNEEGPDHNKSFTIEVKINDKILGIGTGNSKKKAEQMAAKNALEKLSLI